MKNSALWLVNNIICVSDTSLRCQLTDPKQNLPKKPASTRDVLGKLQILTHFWTEKVYKSDRINQRRSFILLMVKFCHDNGYLRSLHRGMFKKSVAISRQLNSLGPVFHSEKVSKNNTEIYHLCFALNVALFSINLQQLTIECLKYI